VVIGLERGADLHMALLMPLPLTVSSFSKIQIGFTFLVPAHPGSPGQRAVKRVCVCVCVCLCVRVCVCVCACVLLTIKCSLPTDWCCRLLDAALQILLIYGRPILVSMARHVITIGWVWAHQLFTTSWMNPLIYTVLQKASPI